MLRIRSVGASALAVIAFTGTAFAADAQRLPPAPPRATVPLPLVPNGWGGHYAGLIGGYGWGGGTIANRGWIGGVYAGFNAQVDRNIIIGIEGDGTLTTKRGSDGVTEDAGALVDADTCARLSIAELDADACLRQADSAAALAASGDLVHTGPTGTNVGDLVIGLKLSAAAARALCAERGGAGARVL